MRVYFIAGGGFTKVGATKNVETRLRNLQIANPAKLRLVAVYDGGHALERAILESVQYRRERGEWIRGEVTVEEATAIVRLAKIRKPEGRRTADVLAEGERPSCECHGEPMYWARAPSRRNGGYWRCGVRHRETGLASRKRTGIS